MKEPSKIGTHSLFKIDKPTRLGEAKDTTSLEQISPIKGQTSIKETEMIEIKMKVTEGMTTIKEEEAAIEEVEEVIKGRMREEVISIKRNDLSKKLILLIT